jgi:hypothetical protein
MRLSGSGKWCGMCGGSYDDKFIFSDQNL